MYGKGRIINNNDEHSNTKYIEVRGIHEESDTTKEELECQTKKFIRTMEKAKT